MHFRILLGSVLILQTIFLITTQSMEFDDNIISIKRIPYWGHRRPRIFLDWLFGPDKNNKKILNNTENLQDRNVNSTFVPSAKNIKYLRNTTTKTNSTDFIVNHIEEYDPLTNGSKIIGSNMNSARQNQGRIGKQFFPNRLRPPISNPSIIVPNQAAVFPLPVSIISNPSAIFNAAANSSPILRNPFIHVDYDSKYKPIRPTTQRLPTYDMYWNNDDSNSTSTTFTTVGQPYEDVNDFDEDEEAQSISSLDETEVQTEDDISDSDLAEGEDLETSQQNQHNTVVLKSYPIINFGRTRLPSNDKSTCLNGTDCENKINKKRDNNTNINRLNQNELSEFGNGLESSNNKVKIPKEQESSSSMIYEATAQPSTSRIPFMSSKVSSFPPSSTSILTSTSQHPPVPIPMPSERTTEADTVFSPVTSSHLLSALSMSTTVNPTPSGSITGQNETISQSNRTTDPFRPISVPKRSAQLTQEQVVVTLPPSSEIVSNSSISTSIPDSASSTFDTVNTNTEGFVIETTPHSSVTMTQTQDDTTAIIVTSPVETTEIIVVNALETSTESQTEIPSVNESNITSTSHTESSTNPHPIQGPSSPGTTVPPPIMPETIMPTSTTVASSTSNSTPTATSGEPTNPPIESTSPESPPSNSTTVPIKPPPPFNDILDCQCGVQSMSSLQLGSTVLRVKTSPWLVEISAKGKHICAGTLISDRYVLTSASCVRGIRKRADLSITSGMQSKFPVTHTVYKLSVHPKYNAETMSNNIALLGIMNPIIPTPNSRPICLPFTNPHNRYNTATLSTWVNYPGNGKNRSFNVLQSEVQILNRSTCEVALNNSGSSQGHLGNGTFCAEAPRQQKCGGDIGGTLEAYIGKSIYEQIGLVSWGIGCRSSGLPGVYSTVRPYIRWMLFQARDGLYCKDPILRRRGLFKFLELENQI